MFRTFFIWIQAHERHLSALAMVAGFIVDSLFFERIDLWQTQAVFAFYTAICFITIPLLHWIETRVTRGISAPRWSSILPIATQFALGGFWSGFVIFYGRSAVFGVSWPFLLFLFLVFIGNEYFRHHSRLVFTSALFFFALYSYAIFAVPVYTGTIGTLTFIMSGIVAIGVFALFTVFLRFVGRDRFIADVWRIRVFAFLIFAAVNISYFTNILPPLPLSSENSGVYHSVWRVPGAYLAKNEINQPWQVRYLGFAPTLHIISGESVYAYGSVFAPTSLATTVVHRWEWHNPIQKKWITKSTVSYRIIGGRDGGYRGYSALPIDDAGAWRVNIETADGRLIARLPFTVELTVTPPVVETITLK
ncbi:DUF2914 domain-containing protein [Candidatus Kaiserbacteria bacterium]|nr:DUF2914 domain-containing protein [Candidatus Kaiserbacteria bacterium]